MGSVLEDREGGYTIVLKVLLSICLFLGHLVNSRVSKKIRTYLSDAAEAQDGERATL